MKRYCVDRKFQCAVPATTAEIAGHICRWPPTRVEPMPKKAITKIL